MIPVTKTFFPLLEDYQAKLQQIWKSGWLTNNGQFENELAIKLGQYLDFHILNWLQMGRWLCNSPLKPWI